MTAKCETEAAATSTSIARRIELMDFAKNESTLSKISQDSVLKVYEQCIDPSSSLDLYSLSTRSQPRFKLGKLIFCYCFFWTENLREHETKRSAMVRVSESYQTQRTCSTSFTSTHVDRSTGVSSEGSREKERESGAYQEYNASTFSQSHSST